MRDLRHLFTWQLGPVQDFIAQARSTRDLWAGSYLLSWLLGHALAAAQDKGGRIVLPATQDQALLEAVRRGRLLKAEALMPSLPNRFIAILPAKVEASDVAEACEDSVRSELKQAGDAAFRAFLEAAGRSGQETEPWKTRWDKQLELFPYITWHAVPYREDDWRNAFSLLAREHASRRNVRDFGVFTTDGNQAGSVKDALSGKEESIGDEALWTGITQERRLFRRNEPLGAPNLVKRFFATARLRGLCDLDDRAFWDAVGFDSTLDVARGRRGAEPDQPIDSEESDEPNGYLAVLAADGDRMGAFFGDTATPEALLERSEKLAGFAAAVEGIVGPDGQVVYAGGDDVLAMTTSSAAIRVARALRQTFGETMGNGRNLSCGIAVAHYMHPLQDMVREAHSALHRAKTERDRGACEIRLMKRAGEMLHWGAKWDSPAWKLYEDFTRRTYAGAKRDFTNRFSSNLAACLRRTGSTGTGPLVISPMSCAPSSSMCKRGRRRVSRWRRLRRPTPTLRSWRAGRRTALMTSRSSSKWPLFLTGAPGREWRHELDRPQDRAPRCALLP